MPQEILVAHVKVLKAKISDDGEKQWSQLQLIEPLRGKLPKKIRVLSSPDAASCGYGFTQGEELVVGLMRRENVSPSDRYPYTANTWTEVWASFFEFRRR
jgi:hypothetical protein